MKGKCFKSVAVLLESLMFSMILFCLSAPAEEPSYPNPGIGPIDIQSITKYVDQDGWSYDPATKTLVLAGVKMDAYANGGYSYTENPEHANLTGRDIHQLFDLDPGTTIIVKEGTVNELLGRIPTNSVYIFRCSQEGDPITIKGGGTLNLIMSDCAIYSQTDVNIENVTITHESGDIFAFLNSNSNKTHKDITLTLDKCSLRTDECDRGFLAKGTHYSGKDYNDALSDIAERGGHTASVKIKNSNIKMNLRENTSKKINQSCFQIQNGYLDIDNSTLDLNPCHEAADVWNTYLNGAEDEPLIRLKDVKLPDDVELSSDRAPADAGFFKGETFVKKGDRLELSFIPQSKNYFSLSEDTHFNNGLKNLTMAGTRKDEPKEDPKEDPKADPKDNPAVPTANALTLSQAEQTITTADTDKNDLPGSFFSPMFLKAKAGKKSITITWKKVPEADSYVIFGNKCGKKMEKIATVTGTKYKAGKLKKGTYYKYTVLAVKGEQVLSTAKTVHATTNGGKKGNPQKLKLKKKRLKLKAGKSARIKGSVKSGKKVSRHVSPLRYESTDPSIADVTKKGKVTAKGAGTCTIFVYAQNGIFKNVKVTVK